MIEKITVAGEATYDKNGQTLANLKNLNFIFGTNGSGKTTISRVIADLASHTECSTSWRNNRPVECLVFNCDFVEDNFASEMPGIFTMGETSVDLLADIDQQRAAIGVLQDQIDGLERTLGPLDESGGKRAELKALRTAFEETCWGIKGQHDTDFHPAFAGLRSSKKLFCDRVLAEATENVSALHPIEDLRTRAATVFGGSSERLPSFEAVDTAELWEAEGAPILAKRIIGQDDIDLAALISRLGNSDWVRQGLGYLNEAGGPCPFCQQEVDGELRQKLGDYFNETYTNDIAAIEAAQVAYRLSSTRLLGRFGSIAQLRDAHIHAERFATDLARFTTQVEANLRLFEQKAKEPSAPLTLGPTADGLDALLEHLRAANERITGHNRMLDNRTAEQISLKGEIWKYLLEESALPIGAYRTARQGLDSAVSNLTANIGAKRAELHGRRGELRELEKQITSVQPTVDAINQTLNSFGFTSFALATAGESNSRYRIVRGDGSNAAPTLSEGERSFITFLYFFHLIRGSKTESGMNGDRVIVFDDPVSSLDSDVLFIVSTLIKTVLAEACEQAGRIKQVFVLTHNIYFHKEVTFDPKRSGECRAHETFWIVRKMNDISQVVSYLYNPIKTSYELLWGEVKSENRSNTTIQNTLRRIVENYFKILGNVDTQDIVTKFQGRDQQIANSLFSWVNDGSHSVHDDLYISADEQIVDRYLRVFREIFVKTGHIGHYRMMMGEATDEPAAPVDEPQIDPPLQAVQGEADSNAA